MKGKTVRVQRTKIGVVEGSIVRLVKKPEISLKDLSARWTVIEITQNLFQVRDLEDKDDVRSFKRDELELVSGGKEIVFCDEVIPLFKEVDEEDEPELYLAEDGLYHFTDETPSERERIRFLST